MSAPTSHANGTQTAVVGTEHILDTITAGATAVLNVSLANMALGDSVRLRGYVKVKSGASFEVVFEGWYTNTQNETVKSSLVAMSDTDVKWTLTQTAGTARTFAWNSMTI